MILASFVVLGRQGPQLEREKPPSPAQGVAADGTGLFDGESITRGQNVWQALRSRLVEHMRANTDDAASGRVVLDALRVEAFEANAAHDADVVASGRPEYAIAQGALTDAAQLRDVARFFWWTGWAAATNRPGQAVSHTQNSPHEPLVGNVPTPGAMMWSFISVVLLLAGIGALVVYDARHNVKVGVLRAKTATPAVLFSTLALCSPRSRWCRSPWWCCPCCPSACWPGSWWT